MAPPSMTVKLSIPSPLWRRWLTVHQGEEGDLSSLLLDLLEDHIEGAEQRRAQVLGFDWQI